MPSQSSMKLMLVASPNAQQTIVIVPPPFIYFPDFQGDINPLFLEQLYPAIHSH